MSNFMTLTPAVEISDVSFHYGERLALDRLNLQVNLGEIFALLGPNGGGKTTLFRLVSTLVQLQQGEIRVFGHDVATAAREVRKMIGVVFQSPSLDEKLTVAENIRHQGRLYGLSGALLSERQDEMLYRLGVDGRSRDIVSTLSGGLKRRVELAKVLVHRPKLLLMDEPSTGLDPGARSSLWEYLHLLREREKVTVLMTTHLLEEAERADRIAILHEGRLVAEGAPDELRESVGGDAISLETDEPDRLARDIQQQFGGETRVVDGTVRFEKEDGHRWVTELVEAFPGRIRSLTVSKPSLEDVFIGRTGRKFWHDNSNTSGKKN